MKFINYILLGYQFDVRILLVLVVFTVLKLTKVLMKGLPC